MTNSEYIVEYLIRQGVTDVFGIPGGVVLDLLYSFDARVSEITPHLCYHEQAAGFSACGYAQSSGKLGVAYATRGPGFTNLITSIADAFCDSLPVLFITGHSSAKVCEGMRVMDDQEIDTVSMVRTITKYSVRIDDEFLFVDELEKACRIAQTGRKGPVFLDISSRIMKKQVPSVNYDNSKVDSCSADVDGIRREVLDSIRCAQRPLFLIGDGINQSMYQKQFRVLAGKLGIPVVSSRFSHDVMGDSDLYYGYIGSHGIRAANFILSKADLIISVGNRMHYPVQSDSFRQISDKAKIIRLDIDHTEFVRIVPNSVGCCVDLRLVFDSLDFDRLGAFCDWKRVCDTLRNDLQNEDVNSCVISISKILAKLSSEISVVADVGNNEFWLSRASVLNKLSNRVFYSKSFGALGCGICKAIGVYYSTRKPVVCFVGDQGLQMNLQELQYISQHNLPIAVVLLNNHSSGMIKDRETIAFNSRYVHTTYESGFGVPDFGLLANGFGIDYHNWSDETAISFDHPLFLEVNVDSNLSLSPNLPKGVPCQDLYPQIDRTKYEYLNSL